MATREFNGTSAPVDHQRAAPLMQFPTASGATVAVTAIASDRTPYTWSCTAGHRDSHPYASLPFCRDDAKAHAAECPGVTSPVEQLAADFARWGSNKNRITNATTITGDRLLRVLRILGRPAYHLSELHHAAEQAAKLAALASADVLSDRRRASRAAQKAVDDAYSAIMQDVDTLFTALTGVAADSPQALNLEIPLAQLAADARTLLAVTA